MDYHASDAGEIIDQRKIHLSDGGMISGGKGNDTILFGDANVMGSAGNDTFQNYGGYGAVVYWDAPRGVTVDLAKGTAQDGWGGTDLLVDVLNVHGSGHDDTLIGNIGNNSFFGLGGNDTVIGGGGIDTFNYHNIKSSEVAISYDLASDTFTVARHTAAGAGTDHLTGISRIAFVGDQSDNVSISRDTYAPRDGFLRLPQTLNVSLPNGAYRQQVKAGDFNADGNMDWILTTQIGTGTAVAPTYFFTGSGDGRFTNTTEQIVPGGFLSISGGGRTLIADFNNDGRSDLFQMNFGDDAPPFPGGINSLLLSSAGGASVDKSSTLPQVPHQNHAGSTGDVNGDGYQDVLVNTLDAGNQLYLNDGKGLLQLRQDLLPPQSHQPNVGFPLSYTQSGIVDVDGDGHPDLILGRWDGTSSPAVSQVLLNDGTGNFSRSVPTGLPQPGISQHIVLDVKAIDLNKDGLTDLMFSVTNGGAPDVFYQTPHIQLLINDGGGKFHDETDARISPALQAGFGSGGWIMSLTDVDMNRDGADDILLTSASDSMPSVLLMNKGDGTFAAGWNSGPQGTTIALDANNDGMTDLVTFYSNGPPAVDLNVMKSGYLYTTGFGTSAVGSPGNDILKGGNGNDRLTGGLGSDQMDGGAGTDIAIYAGKRGLYTVARSDTGYAVSSADGVDALSNVERLSFADAAIALDVEGAGGQAYRLYQAAFNRAPDQGGLGFQMWALETAGYRLAQVAQNFIDSPEFARTYGQLNNVDFVTQLYANVLHRAPDVGGLNFHVGLLNAGSITRAADLVGFSESPENKAALIGVIGDGFAYIPHG